MRNEPTYAEAVRNEVLDRFRSMREELKSTFAPFKMDQRPRKQSELDDIFDRLNGLSPAMRQATMTLMAQKSGHEDNEKLPCEFCGFLAGQIKQRV